MDVAAKEAEALWERMFGPDNPGGVSDAEGRNAIARAIRKAQGGTASPIEDGRWRLAALALQARYGADTVRGQVIARLIADVEST